MIRALYSAASGMTAQQMSIDTIANNLANANTAGYKARRTQFQDLLYQNVVQIGLLRQIQLFAQLYRLTSTPSEILSSCAISLELRFSRR